MTPKITFFFVPGAKSEPDSDVFPNDIIFGVPFKAIEKAIQETEVEGERYVYLEEKAWRVENEKPYKKDEDYIVKIKDGEIISHKIIVTM